MNLQDSNSQYVHSNYDPLTEAKRNIESISYFRTIFFFGIGLGYHLEILLERNIQIDSIYIWEPQEGSIKIEEVKKN